jgi:hypothetical protein
MNMKEKNEQVPIQLPSIARTLSDDKKNYKKNLSLDVKANPICLI